MLVGYLDSWYHTGDVDAEDTGLMAQPTMKKRRVKPSHREVKTIDCLGEDEATDNDSDIIECHCSTYSDSSATIHMSDSQTDSDLD